MYTFLIFSYDHLSNIYLIWHTATFWLISLHPGVANYGCTYSLDADIFYYITNISITLKVGAARAVHLLKIVKMEVTERSDKDRGKVNIMWHDLLRCMRCTYYICYVDLFWSNVWSKPSLDCIVRYILSYLSYIQCSSFLWCFPFLMKYLLVYFSCWS